MFKGSIKKIKAFTLIELLTALVISSIITAVTMYFLNFIQEGERDFKNSTSYSYKIKFLHEKINDLFFLSDSIKQNGTELEIYTNSRVDKINFNNDELVFYDSMHEAITWDLSDFEVGKSHTSNNVKSLHLQFIFEELPFEWYFYKNYGAINSVTINVSGN